MKREIKFRANSIDGYWVYGDLHLRCKYPHIHTEERRSVPIDPKTIGQFTGLTDRNGISIYEGDILVIEGIKYPRHYVVSWNTEKLMFSIGDTPLYALLESGSTTIRQYCVCGNVFDNPSLVQKPLQKPTLQ